MSQKIKNYTERPQILKGCQWFKNGDHTAVKDIKAFVSADELNDPCPLCKKLTGKHGIIETPQGNEVVCPGDYVMETDEGFHFPSKPVYFEGVYQEVK